MLNLVFSAVLIFSIYTMAVLSFFPRESYDNLKVKFKSIHQKRYAHRRFFTRILLISSFIGMLLTVTVVYFFIY